VLGRISVLLLAVSIVLSGCGGTESESAQVRSVVHRFYAALESGNGREACSLLTDKVQEELVRPLRLFAARLKHSIDCPTLLTEYSKAVTSEPSASRELKGTKTGAVTLKGNEATVVVMEPRQGPHYAPLEKTAKGWRISKLIERVAAPPNPIEG
jgi:hypothetical protein